MNEHRIIIYVWKQTFLTFTSAFASLFSNASVMVAVSRFFFEVEISLRERFLGENFTFLAKTLAESEVAMVAMFRKMIDDRLKQFNQPYKIFCSSKNSIITLQ